MIELVSATNLYAVLPLIKQYQTFYNVDGISDAKNREFFSQFGKESPLGCQFLYLLNSEPVGFATVYFSFASTIAAKIAVLNDLYVIPESRRMRVGRELIEHCRLYAADNDVVRLQWITARDNLSAQKFYEEMGLTKSTWEFYSTPV